MHNALIDLERYPIDRPDSLRYQQVLRETREALHARGCAVLSGFLTPQGIAELVAEADGVADKGHRSFGHTNPYFSEDDPTLPPEHPVRRFFPRSNAFVAADHFPTSGPLRRIHDHSGFDAFIQSALEQTAFYRYADPLADVIVNVAEEGNGFPWHFDTNNFTVTLAIQNSEAGGSFEYAPDIRRGGEHFDEVQRVLDDTSDRVHRLDLQPGDLQLFKGRYSLHRVAPLRGKTRRYVAIFSYVEEPDMVGSPERTRQLYGRVLPIHLERAGLRADNYLD